MSQAEKVWYTAFVLRSCCHKSAKTKSSPRCPSSDWWSLVIGPRQLVQPWYRTNHGICGRGAHRASRMFSLIQKACRPSNQTPVASGLYDSNMVLLPCGLDQLVKGSNKGTHKSILYYGLGDRVVSSPQRNCGVRWISGDAELESRRTTTVGKLCTLLLFLPSFLLVVSILCCDSSGIQRVFENVRNPIYGDNLLKTLKHCHFTIYAWFQ